MPTTHAKSTRNSPQWARAVIDLRRRLALNQQELGRRLQYSAMAVSRWERGEKEPADRAYIELGNLAGDPTCWYFWGRAGLSSENLMRAVPVLRERLAVNRFGNFEIVRAGGSSRKTSEPKMQLVAIPLLKAVAASHGEGPGHASSILTGPVETMIAAPGSWCPNPQSTSCLRVRGSSMAPLIADGYIVAIDSSQTDHKQLNGKIVIAWHKDRGLCVSRYRRFDHTEVLEPENRTYESITLSAKQRWKIVAKVLWWIGKAP